MRSTAAFIRGAQMLLVTPYRSRMSMPRFCSCVKDSKLHQLLCSGEIQSNVQLGRMGCSGLNKNNDSKITVFWYIHISVVPTKYCCGCKSINILGLTRIYFLLQI